MQITLGLVVLIKECSCCLQVSSHCPRLALLLFGVVVVHSRGGLAECDGRQREQADTYLRAPSVRKLVS